MFTFFHCDASSSSTAGPPDPTGQVSSDEPGYSPSGITLPLNDPTCVIVSSGNTDKVNSMSSCSPSETTSLIIFLLTFQCVGGSALTKSIDPPETSNKRSLFWWRTQKSANEKRETEWIWNSDNNIDLTFLCKKKQINTSFKSNPESIFWFQPNIFCWQNQRENLLKGMMTVSQWKQVNLCPNCSTDNSGH